MFIIGHPSQEINFCKQQPTSPAGLVKNWEWFHASVQACDPECRINSDGQCLDELCTSEIHWKYSVHVHVVALFALQCFGKGAKGKAAAAGKTAVDTVGIQRCSSDATLRVRTKRWVFFCGVLRATCSRCPPLGLKLTGTLTLGRAEWFLMVGWQSGWVRFHKSKS